MIRIFFSLAVVALACMAVALILGLAIGDLQSAHELGPEALREVLDRASMHRLAGLGAALVVILVNSIAVTYFVGTSRWCKEVVEMYQLDPALLARSQALKRRAFPWAVSSMLAVVALAALGAAADPGTGLPRTADWVLPHFLAALAGMAYVCLAFFVQAGNIRAHNGVIGEIVAEVRRIRIERGLEVE